MSETTDWADDVERPDDAAMDPVFTMDADTGQVTVEYPGGRPRTVVMSMEMVEQWVEDRNEAVRNAAALKDVTETMEMASNRIAELVAENETLKRRIPRLEGKITALRTVSDILRLGRRPNREQWIAAGMLAEHAQLESDRVD